MIDRFLSIAIICIFFLSSCRDETKTSGNLETTQAEVPIVTKQPNYEYVVEIPEGWTRRDTIMSDGLRVRFLIPPQSLITDYPAGNILIASMQGRDIDDFTSRNIDNLKSNMPGIIILERGSIDSTIYNGQWFTYTKEQDGKIRDMINYIIPLNGFAYMITCGSNKGSMSKHRKTFDSIAKSFKG